MGRPMEYNLATEHQKKNKHSKENHLKIQYSPEFPVLQNTLQSRNPETNLLSNGIK